MFWDPLPQESVDLLVLSEAVLVIALEIVEKLSRFDRFRRHMAHDLVRGEAGLPLYSGNESP